MFCNTWFCFALATSELYMRRQIPAAGSAHACNSRRCTIARLGWQILWCVLCLLCGWIIGNSLKPKLSSTHRQLIEEKASQFALDPQLVAAVIITESSGRAQVVSPKGAIGLMQLMPETAEELRRELNIPGDNIFIPSVNIHLGCYYLHMLLREFYGDLPLVLAAYNTGPYRVKRWLKDYEHLSSSEVIYHCASTETRNFVSRVLWRYGSFRNQKSS